ncbi:MAG: ComF family protein [Candidatus Moranbacteria bacterium GW2011_GWE2_35_2-]|nr:MAG: ComF family protein [Candidatus Moranbacteria bacterium GW2011_GWE2_35_2-]KKQ06119.1 MAG: ComF family protein [Candidatus Moranbacteria bacterium GW2011_GWF1_36_4]KKQ22538.1 MAG: ComF family protein [Candidatus Moranbacteria bacterium GW2011_GWF2_37_11]KKQ29607.1 MAG: ComF family protein [Candidatus Moranbacteria bacterium GW2011_GWD1_37_17]KKQ30522.1 MAG: ComF family protein [Candidatus Moranbacteria bacterium GW2011_GWE1_37_24]KKQ46806.1 MAG: ComF family protein [Candidatus Moranbact
MKRLLRYKQKIEKFILDTLFPITCLGCQKQSDQWICEHCLKKISLKKDQICPICEKIITPKGEICFSCHKKNSIDGLLVCTSYKEKIISRAVGYFKYRFVKRLSIPLSKIMLEASRNFDLRLPDIIIPIPLHPHRLRWRGFNQSQLLAQYLGKNLTPGFDIPILENNLIRKYYTSPQMKIKNYKERQRNIQNAFTVLQKENIKNKNILLVDDIATTGSTLFECAKILKQSGAKKVFGIVIARQKV